MSPVHDEDVGPLPSPTKQWKAAAPTVHRVPRPKGVVRRPSSSNSFPTVSEMVQGEMFTSYHPLLPAPLFEVPRVPPGVGHRVRLRWKRIRDTALHANRILRALNGLDSGLRTARTHRRKKSCHFTPSTRSLHRRIWELAAAAVSVRLDPNLAGLHGAHSTASLLKADQTDRYSFLLRAHAQVPMKAMALDEPSPTWPTVPMLDALPWEESMFYEKEEHVVELAGKSSLLEAPTRSIVPILAETMWIRTSGRGAQQTTSCASTASPWRPRRTRSSSESC